MWNWYSTAQLVYYESADGVNFTEYTGVNLGYLGVTGDSSASTDIYSIDILYRPASTPKYEGWVDVAGEQYYITSNDCMTWSRVPGLAASDNILTHSGKDGSTPGTPFHCGGWPSIVYFNGRYTMWYSSNLDGISDSSYNRAISYAESANGYAWNLVEIIPNMGINAAPAGLKSNGILRTDDAGCTWRSNRTYNPEVIYSPSKFVTLDGSLHGEYKDFKMWFTGDGSAGRRIFYASFNEP